jgi:hypothetical protein
MSSLAVDRIASASSCNGSLGSFAPRPATRPAVTRFGTALPLIVLQSGTDLRTVRKTIPRNRRPGMGIRPLTAWGPPAHTPGPMHSSTRQRVSVGRWWRVTKAEWVARA